MENSQKENSELAIQTLTLSESINNPVVWDKETALDEMALRDPRIKEILSALNDFENMPKGWKKTKWREAVAIKYKVDPKTIFNWIEKYKEKNIQGLVHKKPFADTPRQWTLEALEFWESVVIKKEHRHINIKSLYALMVVEAHRRGWKIGGEKSAYFWSKKFLTPTMKALQHGGMRALDNILTPILRDYSDLTPFQILVGDQHRFDRWVMDEETGEIFRPEGYLWQDLRTRAIYGAAVDKKYDAWLIGLALRIGVSVFGAFGSIYTDNGRPELSKFLISILANLNGLNMEWEKCDEEINDVSEVDNEIINPYYILPGTHRKAIVKNAKAKMIEGTFYRLEEIMSSVMLLPGQTKRMSDDIHWQDVDHFEAQKLAKQGKLLTAREFVLALYKSIDFYNSQKPHRGVLSEWAWNPKPAQVTPYGCIHACLNDGWRPRMISPQAADLIFLARDSRVVNKGMISLNNEAYSHDDLIDLHKKRVDIRFNPLTLDEIHIFQKGKYICTALPVQYSSMIDVDLASQKIAEKRERRKHFAEEFKKISSIAPDFRQYSSVPAIERAAALIGKERTRRAIENKELNRPISQEELDVKVAGLELLNRVPVKTKQPLAGPRPDFWMSDVDRHDWCIKSFVDGTISAEDRAWMETYESNMSPGDYARAQFDRDYMAEQAGN
jgi:putative transposase